MQPTAKRGHASLDVLRFAGAAFIVLYHFGTGAPVSLSSLSSLFGDGWLATDFFLLLSGFVLSRAYGRKLADFTMRRSQFFFRRFARLWPPHMVVLLAFGAFILVSEALGVQPSHPEKFTASAFLAQAFLVHGWGMFGQASWNIPTWTLSTLLICYGLFSVYSPWLPNGKPRFYAIACVIACLAGEVAALTLARTSLLDAPYHWALVRSIPLFLMGNFAERASRNLTISPLVYLGVLPLCLLDLGLVATDPPSGIHEIVLVLILVGLLVCSGAVALSESRLTRVLGRVSFSLFLVHSLVGAVWLGIGNHLLRAAPASSLLPWLWWLGGIGVALVTAFVFERIVDRPLNRLVQRLELVNPKNPRPEALCG